MKEDVFIDSGAWSLYRLHVLKTGKKAEKRGRTGRVLEEPMIQVGQGDFTFYELTKGSEFRKYCDQYASFMRHYLALGVKYFANVDVIGNPDLTWETQKFFEKEHGLSPVPVIHFGTPMEYLERYLAKNYEMIGLGGFARRPEKAEVIKWCDEAFIRTCPKSNGRMPIVKVHGFAMTSWHLMRRWPWFSVDSTSWLLYGTYGLMCVPKLKNDQFRFDRPPMIVSVSDRGRPIDYQNRMHISQKHADTQEARNVTMKWLHHIGLTLKEVGSDNEIRTSANLRYFMDLEATLPKWPWPLDAKIVGHDTAEYHRGFGLI